MKKKYYGTQVIFGFLIAVILPSCSSEATTIPTETPISGTPTSQPITFEITFDGSECVLSGPAEVPTGYINIAFNEGNRFHEGDKDFGPWVDHFLEGKTYEDFINDIHIGPETSHPKPEWVEFPFYTTRDHVTWTFTLRKAGEYAVFVGSYTPWLEYPCGPFRVFEASSE